MRQMRQMSWWIRKTIGADVLGFWIGVTAGVIAVVVLVLVGRFTA